MAGRGQRSRQRVEVARVSGDPWQGDRATPARVEELLSALDPVPCDMPQEKLLTRYILLNQSLKTALKRRYNGVEMA